MWSFVCSKSKKVVLLFMYVLSFGVSDAEAWPKGMCPEVRSQRGTIQDPVAGRLV